jgi:hypothetical protein
VSALLIVCLGAAFIVGLTLIWAAMAGVEIDDPHDFGADDLPDALRELDELTPKEKATRGGTELLAILAAVGVVGWL